MTGLLDKIKSRGYWQVVIRPMQYDEHKVEDISKLLPLMQKLVVQLRGWDFPHIDYQTHVHIDLNWIGQEYEWQHHKSSWRFYQSGQFAHIAGIPLDWRDESRFWPADNRWKPGALLGIGDTLLTLVEILEFASRLSLSDAGGEIMDLAIKIGGLKDRTLYIDSSRPRWPLDNAYTASIDTYPIRATIPRAELVAETQDYAIGFAIDLFKRFGWVTTPDVLRDWIEKRG